MMQYYLLGLKVDDDIFEFHGICDEEDKNIILKNHPNHQVFYTPLEEAVIIYNKFINFDESDYLGIRKIFEQSIKNLQTNIIYAMKYCHIAKGFSINLMIELTNKIYYFHRLLKITRKSLKSKVSQIEQKILLDAISFCDALVIHSCKFLKLDEYKLMVEYLTKLSICRQALMNIFAEEQGKKCHENGVDYVLKIAKKELI